MKFVYAEKVRIIDGFYRGQKGIIYSQGGRKWYGIKIKDLIYGGFKWVDIKESHLEHCQ